MVDIIGNGADQGPLVGWGIAISNGRTFLGKLGADEVGGSALSPVYELLCIMQMAPDPRTGQAALMRMRQAMPPLTFTSVKHMVIPEGAIWILAEELSVQERRELQGAVDACEKLVMALRAEESGIKIAPAGAKLPKIGLP